MLRGSMRLIYTLKKLTFLELEVTCQSNIISILVCSNFKVRQNTLSNILVAVLVMSYL